jgi:hypothetical protein
LSEGGRASGSAAFFILSSKNGDVYAIILQFHGNSIATQQRCAESYNLGKKTPIVTSQLTSTEFFLPMHRSLFAKASRDRQQS